MALCKMGKEIGKMCFYLARVPVWELVVFSHMWALAVRYEVHRCGTTKQRLQPNSGNYQVKQREQRLQPNTAAVQRGT